MAVVVPEAASHLLRWRRRCWWCVDPHRWNAAPPARHRRRMNRAQLGLSLGSDAGTACPSPGATPPRREHTAERRALEAASFAERECREQMTNQAEACVVLRGAAVTNAGAIVVPKRANRDFAARYPEWCVPSYHGPIAVPSEPFRINIVDDDDTALTGVEGFEQARWGFYHQPVSGARYRNMWHTLPALPYFTFAHTLRDGMDVGAYSHRFSAVSRCCCSLEHVVLCAFPVSLVYLVVSRVSRVGRACVWRPRSGYRKVATTSLP
jgi:hypothetical protein